VEALGKHLVWLVLEGRFEELSGYSREISATFSRFPSLPVLRDLSFPQRVGARLESFLGHVLAVQSLPGRSKTDALFVAGSRGYETRKAVMQCLFDEPKGLSTQELMERVGIESRQAAHLVLRKLREHGLTVSDPLGQTHHHMLSPSGRRLWEKSASRSSSSQAAADMLEKGKQVALDAISAATGEAVHTLVAKVRAVAAQALETVQAEAQTPATDSGTRASPATAAVQAEEEAVIEAPPVVYRY
jgi:hypothetical protein